MSDEPSATDSRFGPVVDALRRFRSKESKTLSPAQLATTKEIETRLRRLAGQYEELLQVNQRLMDTAAPRKRKRWRVTSQTLITRSSRFPCRARMVWWSSIILRMTLRRAGFGYQRATREASM